MERNQIFTYQYSATQNREIENIRKKYLPKEENKLETLKKLDAKAQTAGQLPSLCLGIIGVLIFGIGTCFGLNVFTGAGWMAILLDAIGVMLMLPAYPVYRYFSQKAKKELTPKILQLSDEIMKS